MVEVNKVNISLYTIPIYVTKYAFFSLKGQPGI